MMMGVPNLILKRDKWKSKAETKKCSSFPGFEGIWPPVLNFFGLLYLLIIEGHSVKKVSFQNLINVKS